MLYCKFPFILNMATLTEKYYNGSFIAALDVYLQEINLVFMYDAEKDEKNLDYGKDDIIGIIKSYDIKNNIIFPIVEVVNKKYQALQNVSTTYSLLPKVVETKNKNNPNEVHVDKVLEIVLVC